MNLSAITKRVRTLETMATQARLNQGSIRPSGQQMNDGPVFWVGQLEELAQEAKRIKKQAEARGDHRTALACIRELCRIVELASKLRGDLDERSQINVVNVHVDSETGKRIAEEYLARRRELEAK